MKNKSWKDLKPLKVKYGNIELFEDYYERIKIKKEFSHIPREVFEQWLWAHHDKIESIKNYGWLDYSDIDFKLCIWSNEKLKNLYVLENYRNYYENRASYNDFDSFCCNPKDLKHWRSNGTWRTPPIILDIESLGEFPKQCELISPYQLVEGHSRLGYLQSMFTIDKLQKGNVAEMHEIFLMQRRSSNSSR
jgi:hypothetical protein